MKERERLILFIVVSGLLLFGWQPLMVKLGLMPAHKQATTNSQPATGPTSGPTSGPATQAVGPVPPAPGQTTPQFLPAGQPMAATQGTLHAVPAATQPAGAITLGSAKPEDGTYALQLDVNPVGGGLGGVTLNRFRQDVAKEERFNYQHPYTLQGPQPLSISTLKIDNVGVDLTSVPWKVESQTDRSVTLSTDVVQGGQAVATVRQTFEVLPIDEGGEQGPRGYVTHVTYQIVNHTDHPVTMGGLIAGPTFPPAEHMRGTFRWVIAGYKGDGAVVLNHDTTDSFNKDRVSKDYAFDKNGLPLLWIGAGTNYFDAIYRPLNAEWIAAAHASALNPESEPDKRQVQLTIETKSFTLAPGQTQTLSADAFFGPRQRSLLDNAYYTQAGLEFNHTLETTSSCAWCTFQWLVNLLMGLLHVFFLVFRDYGIAIILLVFIVRAILHPITKRSQINMAKMSKMGPEIERIKKKYGDDKEGMNRAMMDFYKSHGATPILGCLPMFLQMPIWIALYSGLSSTFELRHEPLFWGLTWVKDLSAPDYIYKFQHTYSLLFLQIDGIHLIPILLAVAFFFQFKLQPKPPTTTPEQQQQQQMMKWLTTFLFPVMLYSSPSGLNIYIFASTLFGVIESHIIRKHIREQEALAAAGPTVVDAEVIDTPRSTAPKKGGGLFGWFGELQQRAEKLREEAEKKARTRKR